MKRLLFEIHDISPVTRGSLEYLIDKLPSNIKPMLMIIPCHKDKFVIDEATIALTKKFNNKQYAQHGYAHDEMTSPEFEERKLPSFPVLTWPFEAEFQKYNFDQAYAKIVTGRKLLEDIGVHTREFIAPAHSTNLQSMTAIQREFPITADNFGIIDSINEKYHKIVAMSTSMNGIKYNLDKHFSKLCEVYIKRKLAKEEDVRVLHHPALEKEPNEHTLDIVNLILDEGYEPVTHAEYLGLA